jgi:hypothetical protein
MGATDQRHTDEPIGPCLEQCIDADAELVPREGD